MIEKYDGLPLLALNGIRSSLHVKHFSSDLKLLGGNYHLFLLNEQFNFMTKWLYNMNIMQNGEEQAYCIIFILLKCGSGKQQEIMYF